MIKMLTSQQKMTALMNTSNLNCERAKKTKLTITFKNVFNKYVVEA